jgi:hypothetical protein
MDNEKILPISSIKSIDKKIENEETIITITTINNKIYKYVLDQDVSIEEFFEKRCRNFKQ